MEDRRTLNNEYLEKRLYAGRYISELARNNNLKHSEGITYLCELSDNLLKIGYTSNLEKRMKDIKGDLIHYLNGGETLELQAHYELRDHRVPTRGEIFFHREAVLRWFQEHGRRLDVPVPVVSTFKCLRCGVTKRPEAFGRLKTSSTGYYKTCQKCRTAPKATGTHPSADVGRIIRRLA